MSPHIYHKHLSVVIDMGVDILEEFSLGMLEMEVQISGGNDQLQCDQSCQAKFGGADPRKNEHCSMELKMIVCVCVFVCVRVCVCAGRPGGELGG